MSATNRLSARPGEWIDRSKPVRFSFEGRDYTGFSGDTISSALHANRVRLLGRSFKYHRPRGIFSFANHDINAMVEDGADTNIRGDVTPIREGAHYHAVNTFGGLRSDWGRYLDWFGRFLPVGFYYKTFHRPRAMFPFFEKRIRAMAGLGAINAKAPRLRTPKSYDFCDVLVIGSGAAGLTAGITAARHGARVVVVDENRRPGGSLTYRPEHAPTLAKLLAEAKSLPTIDIRPLTVAAGCYADHWVALVNDERLVKMRAKSVVIASGCFELPA
ncbi:MAG: (2Fe-2S)-binding protein, partial [Planctomycetes bacterium]|nr:(2Fe-2S)-binding protein [Planctomycetota bacterium]